MSTKKKKNSEGIRFIESIVYIALIIVTIIANTYGNIYIKLIPTLFILGIIGKVIYTRPVITCLFGGVFSIITMYINGTYSINEMLISGLSAFIVIALGEIFGICLVVTLKGLKSKLSIGDKIKNMIITILFLTLSACITVYMNGNIFTYMNAKTKLNTYLISTYEKASFEVEGYRYIPFVESGYSFKVKNNQNDSIYKFVVYEDENLKIYDEYKNSIIKLNNNNINKYIANNIDKSSNINIESEYIVYNQCRVTVKYETELDNGYEEDLANSVIKIMDKLKLYKGYEDIIEIQVVAKNKEGQNINIILIDKEEYNKVCAISDEFNYIMNMLKVEFFDF